MLRPWLSFHTAAHPRELFESDVNRFLPHLTVKENVAASMQNQALAALLFLRRTSSWSSMRERKSLKSRFGGGRWRKLKGVALVRFPNGEVHRAELHWYEAYGVGRRKMKVKRILD